MLKRMKHNQVDFTVEGVPGKYSIDFTDDATSKKQHLQNASVYIKDYIQKELGIKTNPNYNVEDIYSVEDNL